MRVAAGQFEQAYAPVVDRFAAGHLIDEGEREDFEEFAEFAVGFVRRARVAEQAAALEQDLVQVRDHAAGIAQAVAFGEETVDHLLVVHGPVLLRAARGVEFAFFAERDLFELLETAMAPGIVADVVFVSGHHLRAGTVDDINGRDHLLRAPFAVVDAEDGTDAEVDVDQAGAVERVVGDAEFTVGVEDFLLFFLFAGDSLDHRHFGELLGNDQVALDVEFELNVAGLVGLRRVIGILVGDRLADAVGGGFDGFKNGGKRLHHISLAWLKIHSTTASGSLRSSTATLAGRA